MRPVSYDLPGAHVALARWELADVARIYRLPEAARAAVQVASSAEGWRRVAAHFAAARVIDTDTMAHCREAAEHLAAGRASGAIASLAAITEISVDEWHRATRAAADRARGVA